MNTLSKSSARQRQPNTHRLATWIGAAVSIAVLGLAAGCSTKEKLDKALDNANKTAEQAQKLLKNLNGKLAKLDQLGKTPVSSVSPAQSAGITIPPGVVGGADLSAPMNGNQGVLDEDVDEDGSVEKLNFLQGNDGGSVALWWSDEGLCYVALAKQNQWLIALEPCGSAQGTYLCQYDAGSDASSCSACNGAGQCNPCTEQSCDVPGADPGTGGTGGGPGSSCNGQNAQLIVDSEEQCWGGAEHSAALLCEDPAWVDGCAAQVQASSCAGLDACFQEPEQ